MRCSRECFNAARFAGAIQRCAVCDAEVRIPQHRRGKSAYFCSAEHANEWQGRNKTTHACKMCGAEFRRSASLSKITPVTYCTIACRDADPIQRERLLAMSQMQALGAPTSIERTGYAMLTAIGVAFIPQHPIGRFIVDAFVPACRLVVQFDGDYWHFNPAIFSVPDARQRKRIRSDKACAAYMAARGYPMLRLWETDIRKRPERVAEQLRLHCEPPKLRAS